MTSWHHRLSIRTQIFLLALAIVLPVAAMLAWFLAAEARQAREAAHAKVRILADNTAANLERHLRRFEAILGRLAARPLVKALDPKHCDPIIAEFVGLNPEFTTLGVRDVHGTIVCSYLPNPIRQLNPRDFPWFGEGLRSGKFTAGDAFRGRQVGRWVSVLTHPVRDGEGTQIGLLALPVDLLKLGEEVLGSVPKNAVVVVNDRNRAILLRSAEAGSFIGRPASEKALDATRDMREGFLSVAGLDGVQRLYAFVTIPGVEWRVIAGAPEAEVFADFHAALRRSLGIGLGVLLLALGLAWRIGAAITRPIADLAGTAASVAAGDTAARAKVAGPAEIESVAQQFNRMLDARDRGEAALRESEVRYRALVEWTPEPILVHRAGKLIFVNPAAVEMFGATSAHDLIGKPVLDTVHPEFHQIVLERWKNMIEHGASSPMVEQRYLKLDGTAIDVEAKATPIVYAGAASIHVAVRDISQRKQAEAAISKAAQRLQIALEGSQISVWESDLRTGEVWLDSAWATYLGYPAAETRTTFAELLALVHPEDRQRVLAAAVQAMKVGTSSYAAEHRVKSANGAWRWTQSRGRVIEHDTSGRPLRMSGTSTDITERKQAEGARASLEAQLRESQKMEAIGTLAGGIAHDFNNIIATVLGNAELARQDMSANPLALESLEEIRKAGSRARDLVQQILSFSRRQPTERKPTVLAPIVEESVRLLRATLPARLVLEVHCAADVPAVLADATQIAQVLINLVTNAMQAMRSGPGRIEIRLDTVMLDAVLAEAHPALGAMRARRPGRSVRLVVSDDGPGMDAAILERIFEPFFTTKPVGEGTGLGLSVAHGIVQGHEGAIVVDSAPGMGASFTLYLPATETEAGAPEPGESASAAVTAEMPPVGGGRHILHLDDDESLVFLVKRLLERRGYRVSGHTDQREALNALRADAHRFDLVVTDYNMPGMSGLDVAREVRAIRADLPVAVASGFIDEALRAQAGGAGVRELIFKAGAVEEFCEAVQRLAQTLGGQTKSS